MRYAVYYRLFEPLRGGLKDSADRLPAFSTEVTVNDVLYELAVLADDKAEPEAVRITLRGLSEDKIPERALAPLQVLLEHLLSTMFLAYRDDLRLFPISLWSFFDEGQPHAVNFRIDSNMTPSFDPEGTKNFFIASLPFRHEVRLLTDGIDPRVPVQYQFLSLYKLIEHEFKANGAWRATELDDFLEQYAPAFRKLGLTRSPASHLHDHRDRCAHIRTGRSREVLGVNGLNHRATKAISDALPLLRDICRDLLNKKAATAFELGDIRRWHERIEAQPTVQPDGPASGGPAG